MTTEILRGHLEAEVLRLHKARRTTLIASIVVVLIVLAYTSWMYSMVRYFTKPENLAMTVSGLVESQIPNLKHSVSTAIKTQAPSLAKHIGHLIRDEVPAQLRKLVETAADDAANQVAREAAKSYTAALNGVVRDAKAEIAEAVAAKTDEDQRLALFAAVQKQMDTAMKSKDTESVDHEGVFAKLQKAGDTLVRINKKLTLYAGTDDAKLTRNDKQTKRFISTFWRYVQQEYPDAKAGGPPDGAKK